MVNDGLADRGQLFGLVVGDGDVELLLELHDEFDGIEAVSAKVVREARLVGYFGLIHTEFVHDDGDDP